MRAIIAAAVIVALLCVGIFWIGCASNPPVPDTCVKPVEVEPQLGKEDSFDSCLEVMAAMTYKEMKCGTDFSVDELKLYATLAHEMCKDVEGLYASRVEECLAIIDKRDCQEFMFLGYGCFDLQNPPK